MTTTEEDPDADLIGLPETTIRELLIEHPGRDVLREFLFRQKGTRFEGMEESTPEREQVFPARQPRTDLQTHHRDERGERIPEGAGGRTERTGRAWGPDDDS